MSKQVTTVTLKDGTERVYESYPVEDYLALRAELARVRGAGEFLANACRATIAGWKGELVPQALARWREATGVKP